MNDYLSRAAERARDVPRGVRPALPSAFDSDLSFFAPAESFFAPADAEAENNPRAEPSRTIADEQVASVRERVASIKALFLESAPRAPVPKDEAVAKQASVETRGAPAVAREVATSPAKSDRVDPEKPAVFSPGKRTIPGRAPKTDSLPEPERPDVPPPSAPIEFAEGKSPPAVIGKPITPRPGPIQASATSSPRPVVPEGKAGPKFQSSPEPFASADDSPPPGAIHVTIGRVEVRAIHPPPEPAPPRQPPKPALSLDDYLKQRNGGTRE